SGGLPRGGHRWPQAVGDEGESFGQPALLRRLMRHHKGRRMGGALLVVAIADLIVPPVGSIDEVEGPATHNDGTGCFCCCFEKLLVLRRGVRLEHPLLNRLSAAAQAA